MSRATKCRKRKQQRKVGDGPFLCNQYSSSDSECSDDDQIDSRKFLKLGTNQGNSSRQPEPTVVREENKEVPKPSGNNVSIESLPAGNLEIAEQHDTNSTDSSDLSDDGNGSYASSNDELQNDNINLEDLFGEKNQFITTGVTLYEGFLAVLCFSLRHSITGAALIDLLQLISLFQPNLKNTSLYYFRKILSGFEKPFLYHYFCGFCFKGVQNKNSKCNNNDIIHPKKSKKQGVDYFIEIPIIWQLQKLFERKDLFNLVTTYRFHRKESFAGDIYDGKIYQKHKEFFSNPHNFSLMWYSDGVPVYKSTKKSLWPIYFVINELPPDERFKLENMLIGGFWFGSKVQPNLLLKPMMSTFRELLEGISITPYGKNEPVKMKGIVIVGTGDLPAKSSFLGMESSNAKQGCSYCYIMGESVTTYAEMTVDGQKKVVPRGSVTVFPFQNEKSKLRTHEEVIAAPTILRDLQKEDKSIKSYHGIKEPSLMAKIMSDAVNGIAIDYMHNIFEGIMKKFMELWFTSTHHLKDFSIRSELVTINERLEKIRPPSFTARFPRSLDDLNLWKASEYKNFFLYYGLPVLLGVLPVELLDIFSDIVYSVHTLSKRCISEKEFEESKRTMNKFLENFEKSYGVRYMTMNFHLLEHFASSVEHIGATWVSSCFIFENHNGKMLKLVHGTRFAESQLASNLLLMAQLPVKVAELPEGKVKDFCTSCSQSFNKVSINEHISKGVFSVGSYKVKVNLTSLEQDALEMINKPRMTKVKIFHRLKKEKFLFASEQYCKDLQFDNSFVQYKKNDSFCFGVIQNFMKICDDPNCTSAAVCECSGEFFTFIEEFTVHSFNTSSSSLKRIEHIKKFEKTNIFLLIPVEHLEAVVIKISEDYLAVPLNTVEKE